ncbi:MAG: Stp1/IreP family PP2C-type Ser/Thr phosphatase [bacterium]|nr:Stp1/IreP family PP2C-type Ser/Thr phosphatase [bacterium]
MTALYLGRQASKEHTQGKQVSLRVKVIGKTDKGLVRSGNEDYIHIDENHHVYAVCDGMGGHQAGEVASMTASETILKAFSHFGDAVSKDGELNFGRTLPPNGDLLVRSIRLANRSIYSMALQDQALAGMGTTVVAVALEADVMSVAHVGDSRAYCLRDRTLEPLTRDHSWVAEMQEKQNLTPEEANSVIGKNVITRALGVRETVEVDYRLVKIAPGELFILCSDGLCGFADDDEIFDVAHKYRTDLKKLTENLVQMANDRGGSDNVSIVALEIEEVSESPLPALEVFTLPEEPESTLEAEDIWLEKFAESNSKAVESESEGASGKGINPVLLISIFIIFALVAVLVIWMQGN